MTDFNECIFVGTNFLAMGHRPLAVSLFPNHALRSYAFSGKESTKEIVDNRSVYTHSIVFPRLRDRVCERRVVSRRVMSVDFVSLSRCPGSVLIQSTLQNETRFLISHLLKEHLLSGRRCMFVTVDQNIEHYARVLRKTGVSVHSLIASQQLRVFDLLTSVCNVDLETSHACRFDALFDEILRLIKSWPTEKEDASFTLIIDSISTLLCLNAYPQQLLSFCRCCMNIGQMVLGQPNSFMTLCTSDVDRDLVANLRPLFDHIIEPIPIDLLSIANVDGRLRRQTQRTVAAAPSSNEETEFCVECFYRLRETGVVFLPHLDFDL